MHVLNVCTLYRLRKFIIALYFALLATNVCCIYLHGPALLRVVSKCCLMPLLILYFFIASGRPYKRPFALLPIALFFSWLGDVFLTREGTIYFMMGLAAFLIAHILLFAAALLYSLWNNIEGLRIPVMLYAFVLSSMFISAERLVQAAVDKMHVRWIFAGAFLFVLSDSMLAVEKFSYSSIYLQLLVMATYGMAQFCIVKGAVGLLHLLRGK